MNTFLSRANTLFAFSLSVLAGLTLLCFASTAFNTHMANVSIESKNPLVKIIPDYSAAREKNDLGVVSFDLNADLSGLFNWNVKQLFIYLTAEYETSSNKLNQVVVWDKIIKRGENAVLSYRDLKSKYYFTDDGHGLRVFLLLVNRPFSVGLLFEGKDTLVVERRRKGHKNVTMTLSWNVVPNAGTLPKVTGSGSHRLEFPDDYTTSTRY